MKVSVIVPFRDATPLVKECLKAIVDQNYKDIEVIAISNKDSVKIKGVKSFVDTNRPGVGDKRNLGVEKSIGEILLFLDSDCIMKKDTIEKMIKIFKEKKSDAVWCEPLAARRGNLLGYITGLEYEARFEAMGERFVKTAATTCLGVKRKAFEKVGGFKDYTTGEATGEDWDFTANFVKQGFRIFHTNTAQVYHEHGSDTLMKYLKRQYLHARYRPTHAKKYGNVSDEYTTPMMLFTSIILLSIPQTIKILIKKKEPKILLLPFVAFLRNFAWLYGALLGFLFG